MGKTRDPSPSSSSSASEAEPSVPVTAPAKKRKRSTATTTAEEEEELEIDVNAPEPLSKKEARKAKKAKAAPEGQDGAAAAAAAAATAAQDPTKRSEHGIWIGNLPFSVDKLAVRLFFTRTAGIADADITRMHMPTPMSAPPGRPKPANKGFAYVDFAGASDVEKALAVSETLLSGRKVLIKDAHSFEGRPDKATATAEALASDGVFPTEKLGVRKDGKPALPPSKRVFVGNLGFDVTKDELEEHFAQAGEIQDVHMATFEDTGKCKGFAWVRFADLEAAESAVKGFVFKIEDDTDDDDDDDDDQEEEADAEGEDAAAAPKKQKKQQKRRKWFINRLHGRSLRCEFAEDASTRYKKRFGKQAPSSTENSDNAAAITEVEDDGGEGDRQKRRFRTGGDKDQRQELRRKKFDARKVRPGAALANAPRASGAIVEGQGKKISFD